jgi:hypothetical protein
MVLRDIKVHADFDYLEASFIVRRIAANQALPSKGLRNRRAPDAASSLRKVYLCATM